MLERDTQEAVTGDIGRPAQARDLGPGGGLEHAGELPGGYVVEPEGVTRVTMSIFPDREDARPLDPREVVVEELLQLI